MAQYLLFTSISWDKFPVFTRKQTTTKTKIDDFYALRRIEASHFKVAMNHTKDIRCSLKENMSKQR